MSPSSGWKMPSGTGVEVRRNLSLNLPIFERRLLWSEKRSRPDALVTSNHLTKIQLVGSFPSVLIIVGTAIGLWNIPNQVLNSVCPTVR